MREYKMMSSVTSDLPLNSPLWAQANIAPIDQFPWCKGGVEPHTQARLLHSADGFLIKFEVRENPIIARYTKPNDPVCRDSCVEFFIQPNIHEDRYMNFELNPLGTMLIGIGSDRHDSKTLETDREIFCIETSIEDTYWALKFFIPYSFLLGYFKEITNPFKGNLQKCADDSPTPHYGCWSCIGTPNPDFHQPKYFGLFIRE